MTTLESASIGFVAHTGWAIAVVLAGRVDSPHVVARSRVELWDGADRFVFHRASELGVPKATKVVSEAEGRAGRKARKAVRALLDASKVHACAAGIVEGSARLPEDLEEILRSHALVHAAEGKLFRAAIAAACAEEGLPVTAVPSRALLGEAAVALRLGEADLSGRVSELGRPLGRPWAKDHKEAALVAWLALSRAGPDSTARLR